MNSDFEVSAELITVDCDVERSSKGMQRFRTKRIKSELSTVNGGFEGSAAVIAIDLSIGVLNVFEGRRLGFVDRYSVFEGSGEQSMVFTVFEKAQSSKVWYLLCAAISMER